MVKSTANILNPVHQYQKYKNRNTNKKQKEYREDHKKYAQFASDAYNGISDRKGYDGYEYDKDRSSDTHSVYSKGTDHILALKGTSSLSDLIPDLFIATGTQDYSKMYKQDQKLFDQLKSSSGADDTWTVTGHSLGGNRAMYLAQNNDIHSYAYNPGYVGFSDDRINTSYAKHHVVVNEGDAISNSALDQSWKDITTVRRQSYINPIANHSMDNIVSLRTSQERRDAAKEAVQYMKNGFFTQQAIDVFKGINKQGQS